CYARAAALLHPSPEVSAGVHPSACIDPASHVDPSAWVGPYTLIEQGAEVGARASIGPFTVLGEGVRIGSDTRLVARVTVLKHVSIGQRCLIFPGAVIGSDGFGFARDAAGWIKIPQLGSVQIGDDVEIGANTTIDRGAMKDTIIGNGVKLDNQIQVAHNVVIGEHTAMAGFVGVAGSTRIGKRCMIGAGVGFGGHLEVADDVIIKGGAAVSKSIRKRGVYASVWPAEEDRQWWKRVARFRQLTRDPAPAAAETDEGDRPEAG
ncbi:MAG: UDP-3-O-(3-hydroxymyristoyl)glucosamine N-acyltransferase, partial [Gammaproteobacteria bacterium]